MRISSLVPSCLLLVCAAVVPAQTFTVLHVFHGPEGAQPSTLTQDSSGNLYGATAFGGTNGLGTVYKMQKKTPYKETVLHSFSASTDGENPGNILLGSDGYLYGTANGAGANGAGTAFRTTPAGAFNIIYNF